MKKCKRKVAVAAIAATLGILTVAQMGASAMPLPHRHHHHHEKLSLNLVTQAIIDFRKTCNDINQEFDDIQITVRWLVCYNVTEDMSKAYNNASQALSNANENFINAIGKNNLYNNYQIILHFENNSKDAELLFEKIIKSNDIQITINGKECSVSGKLYLKNLVKVLKKQTKKLKKALDKLNESFSAAENQASSSSSSSSISSPTSNSSLSLNSSNKKTLTQKIKELKN